MKTFITLVLAMASVLVLLLITVSYAAIPKSRCLPQDGENECIQGTPWGHTGCAGLSTDDPDDCTGWPTAVCVVEENPAMGRWCVTRHDWQGSCNNTHRVECGQRYVTTCMVMIINEGEPGEFRLCVENFDNAQLAGECHTDACNG